MNTLALCCLVVGSAACTTTKGARLDVPPDATVTCDGGSVAEEVVFPSKDGLLVHATATRPCESPSTAWVVLAHQLCSDRSEWSAPTHDWVSAFRARNVATLAIDLRGHGASKAWPDGSTHDLCAEAGSAASRSLYAGMVGDVQSAVEYARSTGKASAVASIGASIGSNSAIVAFAGDPQTTMVVALSPGLDYQNISTTAPVQAIGARPALLEAADDDAYSASSVRKLANVNPQVTTMVWPTGGHANRIITAHPDELTRVADLVVSTLTQR